MTNTCSHWGLLDGLHDESALAGSYEIACPKAIKHNMGLVLTEAGEVLINRSCTTEVHDCCVAIVIGRQASGLSRPQVERMQRAWDMALAVANGNAQAVQLQPMPHHWRFSRSDYMTIDEWQSLQPPAESRSARPDDTGVRQ